MNQTWHFVHFTTLVSSIFLSLDSVCVEYTLQERLSPDDGGGLCSIASAACHT